MCSPAMTNLPCCTDPKEGGVRKSSIVPLAQRWEQKKVSKYLLVYHQQVTAITGSCLLGAWAGKQLSFPGAFSLFSCRMVLSHPFPFWLKEEENTSTKAETHWPAWNDVGLGNLEASSPLCLGPHTSFILPCSEFWEYRSSQLCFTAGHGEGSFQNPLELLWVH